MNKSLVLVGLLLANVSAVSYDEAFKKKFLAGCEQVRKEAQEQQEIQQRAAAWLEKENKGFLEGAKLVGQVSVLKASIDNCIESLNLTQQTELNDLGAVPFFVLSIQDQLPEVSKELFAAMFKKTIEQTLQESDIQPLLDLVVNK